MNSQSIHFVKPRIYLFYNMEISNGHTRSSTKQADVTSSKTQEREHPEDPTIPQHPVKRGRSRPGKHPIINKENNARVAIHTAKPSVSDECSDKESERLWKEARAGERRSKRIEEAEKREKEEQEETAAAEILIFICKPPSKYKLWDMRQTRILLAHDLTENPPPHYGPFGDSLGFRGGNYIYEQNKRTYEAKVEMWEASELEVDENEETDIEGDDTNKSEGNDPNEGAATVHFVKSERWGVNYKKWRKECTRIYKEWVNDCNE
ncbi:hypothetical protein IQ06DRAFT_303577 [Phaeosphaeriaceae sp. SRC1lsM3a]|nr:hypothetical protein IQ06DRAFT_303577 [Stagonospora sp. SRC1lsM3a]